VILDDFWEEESYKIVLKRRGEEGRRGRNPRKFGGCALSKTLMETLKIVKYYYSVISNDNNINARTETEPRAKEEKKMKSQRTNFASWG